MNGDTKVLDQNPVSGIQAQPQAPVGVANKEMGPIGVVPEIRPAGPEVSHEISQELKELGVKEKKDAPDLTFEHKQIGLEHSGATVPVPSGPSGLVQVPEEKNINNSGTWLNALIRKIQKIGELIRV